MGLTNLTKDHFQYMPSTSITAMGNTAAAQKSKLNNTIAQKQARLDKLKGTGSVINPSGGRSSVQGFGSLENASQTASQQSFPVKANTDFFDASLAEFPNENLFTNPGFDQADAKAKVTETILELNAHFNGMHLDPSALQRIHDETSTLESDIAALQVEVMSLNGVLDTLEEVIADRVEDPSLEPAINPTLFDGSIPADNFITFVQDNIVFPFEENLERFQSITNQLSSEDPNLPTPMFDLVYGPPISVDGQFVLSEDGLYYDSRTGGIPDVTGVVVNSQDWDLEFPPNLGGKGKVYGQKNLEGVFNTLLDFEYDSEDVMVAMFYDADDVLQTFEKDKARHIGIVDTQISELKDSGYSDDSALVVNYYNSLAAVASTYDFKIKKRKKQLQLVALFGQSKYGFTDTVTDPGIWLSTLGPNVLLENTSQTGEEEWHPVDRVPINDFTFLKGQPIDISLDDQAELVLLSEDLDDTILPLQPKFLVSPPQKFSYLERFSLDTIAPTEFVKIEGDSGVSGDGSFVKSLRDGMVTEGMVLGYNFLRPDVVDASSTEFILDNIAPDSGGLLNGQLVASSVDYAFPSGLSIPKLRGTRYQDGGSYVRLPNNWNLEEDKIYLATRRLEDMVSKRMVDAKTGLNGGFSFDFWMHMPNLTFTDAHRYRLVISNDNTGRGKPSGDPNPMLSDRLDENSKTKSTLTHGLIIGFRDRGGISSPSGTEFVVLPTISQNKGSSIRPSVCITEKYGSFDSATNYPHASGIEEVGFKTGTAATTSKGAQLTDVTSTFSHFSLTFDYVKDTVSLYQDGYLLNSAALATTFRMGVDEDLKTPTLTTSSSDGHDDSFQPASVNGPRVGQLGDLGAFTPWILGGGFTDGISISGFLGSNTNDAYDASGIGQHSPPLDSESRSGLDGFIGSFKVYDKPLTSNEVLKNYKAQQAYFKNIQI
jgi:hypothetical protein